MGKYISGIQQMGIGIPDVHKAWKWYREHLSIDVPIFEEAATAGLMLPYTGGQPQDRHAILALSMQGGGGFEIWQYTSRTPQPASFEFQLGDLGINICKIKSRDVDAAFEFLSHKHVTISQKVELDPNGKKHFFIKDPYGNIFQIVEFDAFYILDKKLTGGVAGATIGVTNIDESLKLYSEVLGYTEMVYDVTDTFGDLEAINGGRSQVRRVLLRHPEERLGPFSKWLGPTEIELVQCLDRIPNKLFKDRYWGDLGYIHLCFDVISMKELEVACKKAGFDFTVDSDASFDMGEAAGRFTYIEDPDGTLIEFVETHKIPIVKKIGWYLNLQKRDREKPLNKLMLRALSLNRKKD